MEKTGTELMAQSQQFRRLDILVQPIMRAADEYAHRQTSAAREALETELRKTFEDVIQQWQDALKLARDLP